MKTARISLIISIISIMLCSLLTCQDNTIGKTFTITYYADEAESGDLPEDQIKEIGVDITIDANSGSLSRSSQTVVKWNTTYNGDGIDYALGETYSGNADLSLYAVWGSAYSITYDANGSDSGTVPTTQLKIGGTDLTLSSNTGSLSKTGYALAGWNTQADGLGTKYTVGATYDKDSDLELYAMWYDTSWAKTVNGGANVSEFLNTVVDSSDNIYIAGYQNTTGIFNYDGETLQGNWSGKNAVLIKYGNDGTPIWSTTPDTAPNECGFNDVAVDDSGNTYVCGYIIMTTAFSFGSGITATGINAGKNAVLVKYDSSGNAVWARTVDTAGGASEFNAIATDGTNVFVAGYQTGKNFDYSDGSGGVLSVIGASFGNNAVLLKYSSAGVPQWVVTSTSGSDPTWFMDITVSASGNLYAAGKKEGTTDIYFETEYASGIDATSNGLLVKVDSAGTPIWVRTPTGGTTPDGTSYTDVTTDSLNNIYVTGFQDQASDINFDADTSAATSYAGENGLMVRYSSDGTVDWAKVPNSVFSTHSFTGISCSGSSLYIAGYQNSTLDFVYDTNLTVTGTASAYNSILLKYSTDGTGQWGKSLIGTVIGGALNATAVTSTGVIAVGNQEQTSIYEYGIDSSGLAVSASSDGAVGTNSVIVKYIK